MNNYAPFTLNQTEYIKRCGGNWFNVAEGGKRGGKNVIQILAFCTMLEVHPDAIHLIAGVSQATAKLNILDCNGYGLMNFFENKCREGKYKDRACLYVSTKTGEKIVLISGGAKDGDEKYIKGNTYGMAYVTEANECHPKFIKEVFDRTFSSSDRKIFHDLNPKAPQHWYYTDILEEHLQNQRKDSKYGYNYGHFTVADNLSIDDETLRQRLKTYKKGSVWYERDILGKRRVAEGIIFPDFAADPSPHIITAEKIPKNFRWCEVGFDIGGNGSAYALTITALDYKDELYVLKAQKTQADKLAMEDIEKLVERFCIYSESKYKCQAEYINSDHIAVVVNSIVDNTPYRAGFAYKPPLEDRVFLMSKLLAANRIWFVEDECDDLIDELRNLVFDTKADRPIPLDDGTMQIDTWDSFIYSISGNWKYIDI